MSSMGGVGVGVSHGTCLKGIDRRVRLIELVLRCLICGLGVLAAVLVATDSQVREIFAIRKRAKFTDMKALVFLVIANGVVASYSLIQALRCVTSMVKGSVLLSKPLAWAIFSGDQVIAYVALAAVAAAAQAGIFSKLGQEELQWMKTCNLYKKFCDRSAQGMATAVMASLGMVSLSAISAFSLFRLYGGHNAAVDDKNNPGRR